MSRARIRLLAVAALAVASFAAVPAVSASASVRGLGYGSGATAAAAQKAATIDLRGNYFGCGTPGLVYDTETSGVWNAEVVATCKGYN